jgi:putative membrane protein
MPFLARLAVSWAANAVVLAIVAAIFSGVTVHHSFWTLVFAAAVFGVLNTILKPVLKVLTFPLALATLGVAWFFVAMMMLWLTDAIVGRFDIHGFWTLVGATVIAWLVNLVLDRFLFQRHEGGGRGRAAVTFRA